MARLRKITISVPADLVDDLDYMSGCLGVSRSAVISQLLCEPVGGIVGALRDIPPPASPADDLRYRGRSELVIRERLEHAQRLVDDLFSGDAGR